MTWWSFESRILSFSWRHVHRPSYRFCGRLSRHSVSSAFLKFLDLLFVLFCLLGHRECDLFGDELAYGIGVHRHLPVKFHGCFFRDLGDILAFLEFRNSVV